MSISRNLIQAIALRASLALFITATIAACASIADPAGRAGTLAASSPCEMARQQAWLESQQRRTDGNNDPRDPPEPSVCMAARLAR